MSKYKMFSLVVVAVALILCSVSLVSAVDNQEENFPITICHSDYYMQNVVTISYNDGVNKGNFLHIVDGHKSNYEVEAWAQAAPLSWPSTSKVYNFHSEASFGYHVIYSVWDEQIWELWLIVYHWEDGVCPISLDD